MQLERGLQVVFIDNGREEAVARQGSAMVESVNEFEGGLVLVSHDMRLISQVAKEIWICDDKTIDKYRGDIMNFKMDMRAQMGIGANGEGANSKLRGDASAGGVILHLLTIIAIICYISFSTFGHL